MYGLTNGKSFNEISIKKKILTVFACVCRRTFNSCASDSRPGRWLGLVRDFRMRVRQFPVARHDEIIRAGRPGPVCGDLRLRLPVRNPLATGHVRSDVLHSGYV